MAGVVGEWLRREFAGCGRAVQVPVVGAREGCVGPAAGGALADRQGGVAAPAGEFQEEGPGLVADSARDELADQQLRRADDGLGHGPQAELAAHDLPHATRGPFNGGIGQEPEKGRPQNPAHRRQRPHQLLRGP